MKDLSPGHAHHEEEKHLTPLDLEARSDHLIHCPQCDHILKAEDINIDKLVAKCAHCNHVFSFSHQMDRDVEGYSRPDMLIPNGLEVLKLSNELDIRVDWYRTIPRTSFAFTLIFTLVWNLILLPFVLMAIVSGEMSILLFTSVHILVGLSMLARLSAIFFNTTSVNVSRHALTITAGPLPSLFRVNRTIESRNIDQLYVTKYVESRTNGNPNYAYALYVILKNGNKIRLLNGLNSETQKYLEYEIESFLGIEDRQVSEAI